MRKLLVAIIILLTSTVNINAQTPSDSLLEDYSSTPLISKEFLPSIGVGVGLFNYFGDVNSRKSHSSFVNQLGLNLHISRKIKNYADLGFSFVTGKISGNERSIERNLNFETTIFSGSVYVNYNFYHFLPNAETFQPYLSLGLNFFEYNSKGDLFDINGNRYYYWEDGSIKNLDENSAQASSAIELERDYFYETDLREADLDGFGKYPQIGFGIPLGIGASLNITERINFKIGSTFHFTFTDLLDNVTDESAGARAGNRFNDHFIFNSFTIHYDLINTPKQVNPEDFQFPDFFVIGSVDGDSDGVLDDFDECPETPEGVLVDKKGCPLDEDMDGVPDYIDKEENTLESSFTTADGKTLTESDFEHWYQGYIDSLDIPEEILNRIAGTPTKSANYRILVGEYQGRVPEEILKMYMAEDDIIGALGKGNQTAYLTGKYGALTDAKQRQQTLLNKGFPQATIVVWEGNTFIPLEEWENKAKNEIKEIYGDPDKKKQDLNGFYAVQLGKTEASANSADKAKFYEEEDAIPLPGTKNSTDYVVGPYIDKVSAKQRLAGFDKKTYPDAKVVRVENGKIKETGISTKDVQYDPTKDKQKQKNKLKEKLANLQDAFVIDIGSDKDPSNKAAIEKIKTNNDVIEIKNEKDNTTTLITTDPKSIVEAKAEMEQLKATGVDAKVGQVKNGKLKTVSDAVLNADPKLAKLEGEYVINFADSKDPEAKAIIKKLKADPKVQEIKNADNSSTFISVDPKSLYTAKKEVEALKEKGITTAKINQVKEGKLVPIESGISESFANKDLADLEGEYVINFADTKDPGAQQIINKIKNNKGIKEIKHSDNSSSFISVDPQSLFSAQKEVAELKKNGIVTAEVNQVKNGKLVPTDISSPEISLNPDLSKLEGKHVVKVGNTKDAATQKIIEQIKKDPNIIEIKNNDNSSTFITKDPETAQSVVKKVEKLKAQGITTAKAAIVENGKIKELNLGVKPTNLKGLENKYVVKLGKIDNSTKEELKEKLINNPNSKVVQNEDGTTDIITKEAFKTEKEARKLKTAMEDLGFPEAKIAQIKNGKVEELQKEKLDGNFAITLGTYGENVPQDQLNKILSEPDVESIELNNPNRTTYLIGNYEDSSQSINRLMELAKNGHNPEIVKFKDGKMEKVSLNEILSPTQMQTVNELKNVGDLLHTDEILYRVQVGAYRNKIPSNTFKNVKTIAIPSKGGLTKYLTGSFNTYKQAYIQKLNVWEMGYKGAFVVAYKDGKQIKVTDLVNQNQFKEVKSALKPLEKKPKTETTTKKEEIHKVSYRVQLAAYKDGQKEPEFNEFPDAEMEIYGEYKRYLSGHFTTYNDANKHKEKAKSLGFGKAFVVAYNNGARVAAPGENPNVINVEENTGETRQLKNLMILVQIGLYRGDIPVDLKEKFASLPDITKQVTPQGITRWMTGNFKNPAEAAAYKEKLIAQGFDGAFIVAYYNNEKINVLEANSIWKANK